MDGILITLSCLTLLKGVHMQRFEVVSDNSRDVYHILYGDLTKMDDMFIDPVDYNGIDEDRTEETDRRRNHKENISTESFMNVEAKIHEPFIESLNHNGVDTSEFIDVNQILNNGTRRQWQWFFGFNDPEDSPSYTEAGKKKKVADICLQFLIHTRYKISGALKQKESIRYDKRYKMGYLFNRLRRLKYDMRKLIYQAKMQGYYETKYLTLRIYQKVVRIDVDIKDTIEHIKLIDKEPEQGITFTQCQILEAIDQEYPDINDMFPAFTKTIDKNVILSPNVVMKNISIDLEKINTQKYLQKLDVFKAKFIDFDKENENLTVFLNETRRLPYLGNPWEWNRGSSHMVKTKCLDMMLQLIYMARHKIRELENEKYFNRHDTSYRIAFLYRRIRRMWKKMLDIMTMMKNRRKIRAHFNNKPEPYLILHHKAAALHVDFLYLWWVLVNLHEKYNIRHHIPNTTPSDDK